MTTPANRPTLASDNYAPVHPSVLAALAEANTGPAPAYGADQVTASTIALMQAELETDAEIAFVFNGTGANLAALHVMLRPWQHVVCTEMAHIAVDECGAAERALGVKLVGLPAADGRLTIEALRAAHQRIGDEHSTQPGVVSLTQCTELGTVYSVQHLTELAEAAHELGLYVHLDGARIANAAVSLGVSLADITWRCGVDVMSFGGTKNGLMGAEAVVVFRDELKGMSRYTVKQLTQLGSKRRYLAAQFAALFTDDLWRRNALHANEMASRLAEGMSAVPGVQISHPVQANEVFAQLPREWIEPLQRHTSFYTWDESANQVRWVCAWDTSPETIDAFVAEAKQLSAS